MYALRGAIDVPENEAAAIVHSARSLMSTIMEQNGIEAASIVSVFVTATPDLTAAYPAAGVRAAGLIDTPILGAQESDVVGGLPRIVRVLVHIDGPRPSCLKHVFLGAAAALRPDWSR